MKERVSKREQLQIFERRAAVKRRSLEEKERQLEHKERQLKEERRQLAMERQRHDKEYEDGKKFINELWAVEADELVDRQPEPRLEETQGLPMPGQESTSGSNGAGKRSISEEVLLIVDEWPDDSPITQSEVTKKFEDKYPDRKPSSLVSLISHTLSQSAKDEDGILELVEKGAGSRPTKYRKRTSRKEAENLSP